MGIIAVVFESQDRYQSSTLEMLRDHSGHRVVSSLPKVTVMGTEHSVPNLRPSGPRLLTRKVRPGECRLLAQDHSLLKAQEPRP